MVDPSGESDSRNAMRSAIEAAQTPRIQVEPRRTHLVDMASGMRLVAGFAVAADELQRRLPEPWRITFPPASLLASLGVHITGPGTIPNLFLVFNDFLLNQNADGEPSADVSSCYVGFNTPAINDQTGEQAMVHMRVYTDNPQAVPGRFKDSLPASVNHDHRVVKADGSSTVFERFEVEPDTGGRLLLALSYQRGQVIRVKKDEPDFPLVAAADPRIVRIYQEDSSWELVRLELQPRIDRITEFDFQLTIPEWKDLFDGSHQLASLMVNATYSRAVFSPNFV
jgi:hypothetical protein